MTLRFVSSLVILVIAATCCGGARHRKVAGPPPEYELPDQEPTPMPVTSTQRDAGNQ